MKFTLSILLLVLTAFSAGAQDRNIREATAAEMSDGTAGLPAVLTPRRLGAGYVKTNQPSTSFPQTFSLGNALQPKIPGQIWAQQRNPIFSLFVAPHYGYAAVATNGWQTNIVYLANAFSNSIPAVKSNGITVAIQIDAGWDYGRSNNNGAITWNTNFYPLGIPWLNAMAVSNQFNGLMLSQYWLNYAIPNGAVGWTAGSSGTPYVAYTNWSSSYTNPPTWPYVQVMTPQTIQRDIDAIVSWGVIGLIGNDITFDDSSSLLNMEAMIADYIVHKKEEARTTKFVWWPYERYGGQDQRTYGGFTAGFKNASTYENFGEPYYRQFTNYLLDFAGIRHMNDGGFVNAMPSGRNLLFAVLASYNITIDCRQNTNSVGLAIQYLSSPDVVSVWKDTDYNVPFLAKDYGVGNGQVWAKKLSNGDVAGVFISEANVSEAWPTNLTWDMLGIPTNTSIQWQLKSLNQSSGGYGDFSNGTFTNSVGLFQNSLYGSNFKVNWPGAALFVLHNPNTYPSSGTSTNSVLTMTLGSSYPLTNQNYTTISGWNSLPTLTAGRWHFEGSFQTWPSNSASGGAKYSLRFGSAYGDCSIPALDARVSRGTDTSANNWTRWRNVLTNGFGANDVMPFGEHGFSVAQTAEFWGDIVVTNSGSFYVNAASNGAGNSITNPMYITSGFIRFTPR